MPIIENEEIPNYVRQVPLILIEHLRGKNMYDIDAYSLTRELRSVILKKALDAEMILFVKGISYRDCAPRNIMIMGLDNSNDNLDNITRDKCVKSFDFNIAIIRCHLKIDYYTTHKVDHACLIPSGQLKLPSLNIRNSRRMNSFVEG